jgi:CRP/FNR family cyclic AMP-dependent transcriptional regulator
MSKQLSEEDLETLAETTLFCGLGSDELQKLVMFAPVRRYKARTVIMEKGDEASALYVILDGSVRIFAQGEEEKEITLNELGAGQYFGELALITDKPRCASAITTTAARLLAVSKPQFTEFLATTPDAAPRMIHYLAEKVRELTHDVERLALQDVYGRLVGILEERAEEADGRLITGPITQQELANLVGASREMISRIFKELKSGGYISLEGKRIVLERELPARW